MTPDVLKPFIPRFTGFAFTGPDGVLHRIAGVTGVRCHGGDGGVDRVDLDTESDVSFLKSAAGRPGTLAGMIDEGRDTQEAVQNFITFRNVTIREVGSSRPGRVTFSVERDADGRATPMTPAGEPPGPPPASRRKAVLDEARAALAALWDEERLDVFRDYCRGCGKPDPTCWCENDE